MSNEVEEYSDELKREADDELRDSLGKTSIMFFNLDQMGAVSKFVCLVIIMALFGGVFYFFYKELVIGQPDINEVRKQKLAERKEKRKSQ